jgi:hypothetical protein
MKQVNPGVHGIQKEMRRIGLKRIIFLKKREKKSLLF